MLNAPAFAVYDSTIRAFVGAWESIKNNRFPPTRDDPLEWGGCGEISKVYGASGRYAVHAVRVSRSGNKEGAEWLCDSLIKWWNTIRFRFDNTRYYILDARSLTLELLDRPWQEARNVIDLSVAGNNEGNAQGRSGRFSTTTGLILLCVALRHASVG